MVPTICRITTKGNLLSLDAGNDHFTFGASPLISYLISKRLFGFILKVKILTFFNNLFITLPATEVPPSFFLMNSNYCSNNYAGLTLKMVSIDILIIIAFFDFIKGWWYRKWNLIHIKKFHNVFDLQLIQKFISSWMFRLSWYTGSRVLTFGLILISKQSEHTK